MIRTACSEWKEMLLDHALGGPAARELRQHLAGCARCTAALGEWRERAGRLDEGLRRLVNEAQPRADLQARILEGVESSRPAPVFRSALATAMLALVVVVGGGLFVLWSTVTRSPGERQRSVSVFEWRSPTESLLRSSVEELLSSDTVLGELYFPIESPRGGSPDQGES